VTALVIGVGHPDRGDDAVGLLVAAQVRRAAPDCEIVEVQSPTQLMDLWDGHDVVVVTDAVRTGRDAGAVTLLDASQRALPAQPGAGGSHGLGIAESVELARALGRLPARVLVVGVEAVSTGPGAAPAPVVVAAVPAASRAVLALLACAGVEVGDGACA
jgi:hydrogenase maturation protease